MRNDDHLIPEALRVGRRWNAQRDAIRNAINYSAARAIL